MRFARELRPRRNSKPIMCRAKAISWVTGCSIRVGIPIIGSRLYQSQRMRYRNDIVQEGFDLDGRLGYLSEHVLQYPWPTLETATAKLQRYSTFDGPALLEGENRNLRGRWPGWPLCCPITMFLRTYLLKQGFRDGLAWFDPFRHPFPPITPS